MAIQSLFGPSIADIQELRRQQAEKDIAASGQEFGVFAPLYRAGSRFGRQATEGINTLMGVQDPMLKKAVDIQSVLSQYQGQDLNDPTVLGQIASNLSSLGYTNEAFSLAQTARAIQKETAAETRATEELGIRREDLNLRRTQAAEAKETNLITTSGDPIFKKEGKFVIQTTDDEGNIVYKPYTKKAYGAIETKSDYARAQAAAGGSAQRQTIYGPGGLPIGYDVLDSKGKFVRRELYRGGVGATAGAEQPTPGAPVPNIFKQALEERLKNQNK